MAKAINREIKVLRVLSNEICPNITHHYYDCMSSNHIYIFQEYCNQGDLQQFIDNRQFVTETEVMVILQQVTSAFLVLVQKNILHRDLKPANIMIHNKMMKITDFGFSRIMNDIHKRTKCTQMGTPLYMSPEILMNQETVDGKCDVWSMGIIIYILLYHDHPFKVIRYTTNN